MVTIAPTTRAIITAGVRLRVNSRKATSIATVPSMPPRDFVKTMAISITTQIPAHNSRFAAGPGRFTYIIASGRNAARFIARSFGFSKKPPTGPAARLPSTRLTPRR